MSNRTLANHTVNGPQELRVPMTSCVFAEAQHPLTDGADAVSPNASSRAALRDLL